MTENEDGVFTQIAKQSIDLMRENAHLRGALREVQERGVWGYDEHDEAIGALVDLAAIAGLALQGKGWISQITWSENKHPPVSVHPGDDFFQEHVTGADTPPGSSTE